MPPVELNTQASGNMAIIALRPFMHASKTVSIGDEISLPKGDAKHIIACNKAVEATDEGRKKAAAAKAEAAERSKRLEAAATPAVRGGNVDVKALVAEVTKSVREALSAELKDSVEELKAGMAAEVKKQVEEALKAAKK
jgi:hypothetical protein